MMPGPIDTNYIIQQMPHLSKLVTAEHVAPELQKSTQVETAAKTQKRDKEQVQQAEEKQDLKKVGEDGGGGGAGGQQMQNKRRRKKSAEADPEEAQTHASNASPWTGHLLNVKI